MKIIERNLIIDIKPQKPHCKNFWWKCIENESRQSYLGNKEQKATFSAVSRLDADFGFARQFFAYQTGRARKIMLPKNRARGTKFVKAWIFAYCKYPRQWTNLRLYFFYKYGVEN